MKNFFQWVRGLLRKDDGTKENFLRDFQEFINDFNMLKKELPSKIIMYVIDRYIPVELKNGTNFVNQVIINGNIYKVETGDFFPNQFFEMREKSIATMPYVQVKLKKVNATLGHICFEGFVLNKAEAFTSTSGLKFNFKEEIFVQNGIKNIYDVQLGEHRLSFSEEHNYLLGLVEFFKFTSKWQDSGLFQEAVTFLDKGIKKAKNSSDDLFGPEKTIHKKLFEHVEKTGRVEFGWNRTAFGEEVNFLNVYIGDRYGLSTLSIEKWLKKYHYLSTSENYSARWDENNEKYLTNWFVLNNYISEQAINGWMGHYETLIKDLKMKHRLV